MPNSLRLSRESILGHRLAVGGLTNRAAFGESALGAAAAPGLSDSMPRGAVTSLHARLREVGPDVLTHPTLTQVWGPRFSVYVVAERDVAVFTIARHPDSPTSRRRAEELASRIADHLGDAEVPYGEVGSALGEHPSQLRYATSTGTVRIRWDGARQPTIRVTERPDVDEADARAELARRYLHALGVGTAEGFGRWAGIKAPSARAIFDSLAGAGTAHVDGREVRYLVDDEESLANAGEVAPSSVRLLPSGDIYYLLWGDDRRLLVDDEDLAPLLWTSRVWPGAVLAGGRIVGTWRRSGGRVEVQPWHQLEAAVLREVEAEAEGLPIVGGTSLVWAEPLS